MKSTRTVFCFLIFFLICSCQLAFSNSPSISPTTTQTDEFAEFDDVFDDQEETPEISDPLISYNRFMFKVNDKLYFWVLKPVATKYKEIVPTQSRIAVKNFFNNLMFPINFVNNLLQGKFKKAGTEGARFTINTTLGILGFFDVAQSEFDLLPAKEDFGQTLGVYGFGDSVPLVLPFFGFSNLRDAFGRVPDYFLDPTYYYLDKSTIKIAVTAGELINNVSLHLGEYESLKADAFDPYTSFRNIYQQYRKKKIKE